MKTITKSLIATLISATALTLSAQDTQRPQRPHGPQGGPEGRGHRGSPLVGALDANHDGVIDATEIANASKAIAALDTKGTGQLTLADLRPGRPAGAPQGAPEGAPEGGPEGRPAHVPPLVGTLDANHDGVLDATEIANASAALLSLDANKDGQLTMEEIRPARPEGGRNGAGPGKGGRGPGPHGPRGNRPTPPAGE